MNYLDTLRNRRRSPKAAEHVLRISIGSGKYQFFMVVEGEEDEEYYSRIAEDLYKESFQTIVCDGKGGVLGLRDFADRDFADYKNIYFFIDRDHDDYLSIDHSRNDTYVTDGYSMEWDVCTPDVLFDIFRTNYMVGKADELLQDFVHFIHLNQSITIPRLRTLMLIMLAKRRLGEDPDLSNLRLNALFRYKAGTYSKIDLTQHQINNLVASQNAIPLSDIRLISRELRSEPNKKLIRGKLILSLYCDLIYKFATEEGRKKANGRPLRARIQIGKRSFVHLAVSIVKIPDSLRSFFQSFTLSKA